MNPTTLQNALADLEQYRTTIDAAIVSLRHLIAQPIVPRGALVPPPPPSPPARRGRGRKPKAEAPAPRASRRKPAPASGEFRTSRKPSPQVEKIKEVIAGLGEEFTAADVCMGIADPDQRRRFQEAGAIGYGINVLRKHGFIEVAKERSGPIGMTYRKTRQFKYEQFRSQVQMPKDPEAQEE